MNKLLIVSELGNKVSYSYVINDLKKILNNRYDCYYFCVRNLGEYNCRKNLTESGYDLSKMFFIDEKLFFSDNGSRIIHKEFNENCASGIIQIESVINYVKPDIILLLGDTELIKHICLVINRIKTFKGKLIPYLPLDNNNASSEWFSYKKDFLLTVSNHSKKQFLKFSEQDTENIHTKNVEDLPHLIDEKRFFSLEDDQKKMIRAELYGNKFKDYFIVGSVNCNCFRKKWDILIHSFCVFAEKHPNSILVIKTVGNNERKDCVYGGYDIKGLILKYCSKYIIDYKRLILIDKHLSHNELNNLYNTFDVFLTTTSGEGWGLTSIEAGLTKTPVVAPYDTTFPEIFGRNYYGLFPVKQYSIYIARTDNYIDVKNNKINGLFNVICTGYKSYKKENIDFDKQLIDIKIEYPTLLVYNNNSDINIKNLNIFKTFSSYEECLKFIDSNKCPILFQVIIEINFDLLNECLYEIDNNNFFKQQHYHKIVHLGNELIKNSCNLNNPTCGLGTTEDIYDKLKFLYENEEDRINLGKSVYERLRGKFTHNCIEKRFNEIMDRWDL